MQWMKQNLGDEIVGVLGGLVGFFIFLSVAAFICKLVI